jgi:hypothetical protein
MNYRRPAFMVLFEVFFLIMELQKPGTFCSQTQLLIWDNISYLTSKRAERVREGIQVCTFLNS